MANNYRELYESIDAILDEEDDEVDVEIKVDNDDEVDVEYEPSDEHEEAEESASPHDLLKEIVGCLAHCTEQLAANEMEDIGSFVEKLKKVRDILAESEHNEHHEDEREEEVVEEDAFTNDSYGAAGMGPRIDKNGKQYYDNPQGQSYAARKGFVGL